MQWPPVGIKPYYCDDYTCIINGDCREILPTLELVDLVLTDPPYGINADLNAFKNGIKCKANGFKEHLSGSWDNCKVDAALINTILSKSKYQIIWGGNYYTDILKPTMSWLIWDKVQRGFSFADCEMAWSNKSSASRIFTYARGNESGFAPALSAGKKGFQNSHPTQKPVALIKWCISFFPEAQTILDPFMGSGTTLRAAKDLNRKAIGIEIEEKYCAIAAQRMCQEVLEL